MEIHDQLSAVARAITKKEAEIHTLEFEVEVAHAKLNEKRAILSGAQSSLVDLLTTQVDLLKRRVQDMDECTAPDNI